MGADEFRDYILGFIFYKYLSERINIYADRILGEPTYRYAISPALPAGLIFSESNGFIFGTPTEAVPATSFTVTVTDRAAMTASTMFAIEAGPRVTTWSANTSVKERDT